MDSSRCVCHSVCVCVCVCVSLCGYIFKCFIYPCMSGFHLCVCVCVCVCVSQESHNMLSLDRLDKEVRHIHTYTHARARATSLLTLACGIEPRTYTSIYTWMPIQPCAYMRVCECVCPGVQPLLLLEHLQRLPGWCPGWISHATGVYVCVCVCKRLVLKHV